MTGGTSKGERAGAATADGVGTAAIIGGTAKGDGAGVWAGAVSFRRPPLTRAQIEDFQLNDVNALLTTVPGVNVQANETDRYYFSARGFEIQTFQIDGIGVPFAFYVQTGSIDTAPYDHIEVVRGAPGLWVADASAFPTSMGLNPSLTIAALALRVAERA